MTPSPKTRSIEPNAEPWYHEADLPRRRWLAIVTAVSTAMLLIFASPVGELVDNQITRPIEFRARRWLGKDPKLDPRIKIYAFGDSTLELLGREDLTLSEWTKLLSGFAPMAPKAVFIDKLFGTPLGITDAPAFVRELKSLPFPIIAGAFVLPSPIPHRPVLPTEHGDFSLRKMAGMGEAKSTVDSLESLEWLPTIGGVAYGPNAKIREGFRHVGHLVYHGNFFVDAFIRLSRTQAVPMAPLFVAQKREWKDGSLFIDDKYVPMDSRGRLLVNMLSPSKLLDVTYSLTGPVKNISEGAPLGPLPKDAVVVILPGMFTGGTDRVQTPFGLLPGGYQIISLINSVLTGKWIRVFSHSWAMILLSGIAGAWLGLRFNGIRFWLGLLTMAALLSTGGILSFSYLSFEFSWLFCVATASLSALSLFAEMSRRSERMILKLRERMAAMLALSSPSASPRGGELSERDEPAMSSRLPIRIGKYLLLERLGQGGMAEVYLGKAIGEAGFEKLLAVKRILPVYSCDPASRESFEFEARLSSKLSHPNIVHVYDFVPSDKGLLLVMEYVSGRNISQLQERMQERGIPLPVEYALLMINEVLRALDYAHTKKDPHTGVPLGIIHRDISPRNIVVSSDSVIKLLDFGIAKARDSVKVTRAGSIRGTVRYLSPERAMGHDEDQRSDLFSVGVVLYELLSGKPLFSGINEYILIQVQTCEPVRAAVDALDVPNELKKILYHALERDPENRYADAAAFHFDLQEFFNKNYSSLVPKRLSKLMHELFGEEMMEERKRMAALQKGVAGLSIPTEDSSSRSSETPQRRAS